MIKAKVIYRKAPKLSDPTCMYPGFKQEKIILPKGTLIKTGHTPLESDIIFDRDVAIPVRDGVILYADIFRPTSNEKVPAILNSTTFGKRKKYVENDSIYSVPGVLKSMTSGLETFEGTDPGYFVPRGYAVCNLDIRGCYMSGGKGQYFGSQEAEDDYDVIEWLASQAWCNGCVTMTGNSWLGIDQWYAAAQRPPHLTCIAPWEGWSDMYRDEYMVGGIPDFPGFRYNNSYSDTEEMEDVVANILAHPLFDGYWEDKAAPLEKITVPAYIVASYISLIHSPGTFRAWRKIASREKWLRVHHTQEWRDLYDRSHEEEMLKFFDHYMKGKDNGWEKTPRVRVSVLDPGGTPNIERIEQDFPLPRQELKPLYLNAGDMSLSFSPVKTETNISYCGWNNKGIARFTYTFDRDTEIIGYCNVRLWVESDGYNDMDLFVKIAKLDANGNHLYTFPIADSTMSQYSGPVGRMRVSMRKIDPERSTENEPYYPYNEMQKLQPYEIVPVEILLTPTGLRFHKGEKLEFAVSGFRYDVSDEHPGKMKFGIDNNGNHIIHTGGSYDSRLILPFIPIE